MRKHLVRDGSIDRLLRRQRAVGRGSEDDCLDAETLAAWMDNTLSPRERELVEVHAADCARCQGALAALSRTTPVLSNHPTWLPRGANVRWVVPAAAAAAAIVLWVVAEPRVRRAADAPASLVVEPADSSGAPVASDNAVRRSSDALTARQGPASNLSKSEVPARTRVDERVMNDAQRPALPSSSSERPMAQPAAGRVQERPAPEARAARPAAETPPPSDRASPPGIGGAKTTQKPPEAAPQFRTSAPIAAPAPAAASAAPRVIVEQAQRMTAENVKVVALEVVSPDRSSRWRVMAGTVQHSNDAGVSWQQQDVGGRIEATAGASPSPGVCWLVGRDGAVLLTTDGHRWQRLAFPYAIELVAVQATDAKTATVTASDSRRFETTDGGRTWTPR